MSEFRRISMPTCPYCGTTQRAKVGNSNYSKLVKMATGTGSSNVVLQCECCGKKYRVTCSIRFFAWKNV